MSDDPKDKQDASRSFSPRYEPFSPYYLRPSEGTSAVISPILLKGDNYDEWCRSLRNNLRAKNKLGFIDGTTSKSTAQSPDYHQWGIVNSMLVAWICNTLDVSVRSTMRFLEDVQMLWDDLRDRYSLGNGPRVFELKNQIRDCKQRGRSVAAYFGELCRLQDELASAEKLPVCTCSAATEYAQLRERAHVHEFCLGLDPTKFGTVVSGLLLMDPLPSLNVVYAKIISDERKQAVTDSSDSVRSTAVGFAASSMASGRMEPRVCSHCGRTGHSKDRCYELVGWPESVAARTRGGRIGRSSRGRGSRGAGRGSTRGGFAANVGGQRYNASTEGGEPERASAPTLTDEQWSQLLTVLKGSKATSSTEKLLGMYGANDWIIDSGASNHMSGNLSLFFDCHDISSPVGLPNGKSTTATKEGKIRLCDGLILENVLFVPTLTCSLLSVSQLLEKQKLIVIFSDKFCII